MKIVFNTSQPQAAASLFYYQGLETLENISFFDNDFSKYDVALVMTYDHCLIEKIKKEYKNLKVGLIDPRSYAVLESVKQSDFLIVDSIEMEDYWRIAKKPIFRYVEYPKINWTKENDEKRKNLKKDQDVIYIGYHGNLLHIMEGSKTITPALEKLGEVYNIELILMSNNITFEDEYLKFLPNNIKINKIQWSMDNYAKFLSLSDIGIVPNSLGLEPKQFSMTGDPKTDYFLSFKMPSNPGRFITFGHMGIPVVADFFPSSLQLLQNGVGFVAHSESAWYYCLESLIRSKVLREKMGTNLQKIVNEKFNYESQNKCLISFLQDNFGED